MNTPSFRDQQEEIQKKWRTSNISSSEFGYQNGEQYEHIIPRNLWHETLWPEIRKKLPEYLSKNKIKPHTGTHNLLSSWVLCANLYFAVETIPVFRSLMLGFLRQYISDAIKDITKVELEYSHATLSPEKLLGEKNGMRGSGQTSPDVAFIVQTEAGNGLILTVCKYTEHSFYPCSARRTTSSEGKSANPDPKRCLNPAISYDFHSNCHQTEWDRKYWQNLTLSMSGKSILKHCPAALAGYQLFRQHSLAEALATQGDFDLVVSSVAFDGRNDTLKTCLSSTGISDFTIEWAKTFSGKTVFKTWTHQQWVEYVRQNGKEKICMEWVDYLNNRYGY